MSKDGGPAFPDPFGYRQVYAEGQWQWVKESKPTGMSLRDWFAGLAMQSLIIKLSEHTSWYVIVEDAYKYADAMLERRNK